jgi:predicted transcriptional regulator
MVHNNSDMPDLNGLSDIEREIFEFILENWPTTPLEIAQSFNENVCSREDKKRLSTKYAYYLKKLVDKNLVFIKKAGNAIIAWPLIVEKYRVIHEILKSEKYEYSTILKKIGEKNA